VGRANCVWRRYEKNTAHIACADAGYGADYVARIKFEFSNDPQERNLQMLEKLLEVDPTSYDPSVAKPETSNENYLQWLLSEGVCQGLLSFLLRPTEVKPQGHPRFKGNFLPLIVALIMNIRRASSRRRKSYSTVLPSHEAVP
jgi:hypothetical protein